VLADPATPEDYIAHIGLTDRDRLAAVMVRPNKGSALIGRIISSVGKVAAYGATTGDEDMLLALLGETQLDGEDVHAMTHLAGGQFLGPRMLTAVCLHPLADRRTVIDSVWRAPVHVAAAISAAAGTLLPAATSWVSRRLDRDGRGHERVFSTSALQYNKIVETAGRWDAWAGADPTRVSFLATTSFAFTEEQALFDAGAALLAPPERS